MTDKNDFPFSLKSHGWMYPGWCVPVVCGFFMARRLHGGTFGLPIDDAYIYVKYIENLAQGSGYSFNPGETSFGVTSFLFTILGAAIKKVLPWLDAVTVCLWIGMVSHGLLLWFAQRVVYRLTENYPVSLLAGFMLAFCRPIYFTAPSGLETLLFLSAASAIFYYGLRTIRINLVVLGVGGALLYLSRPEGLYFSIAFVLSLLAYPLLFESKNVWYEWKRLGVLSLYFLFGLFLAAAPYLAFVKWHSGHWMPMTFYGKLLNRSDFLLEPWYEKIRSGFLAVTEGYQQIMAQDSMPFTLGLLAGLSLISFASFVFRCGREKPAPVWFAVRMAMFAFFAFPFLFGAVFSTSPMFGGYFVRYIQIAILVLHIEGAAGLHRGIETLSTLFPSEIHRARAIRVVSWLLLPCVVFAASASWKMLARDTKFYQENVAVNEKVRKRAAEWIAQNTQPDARILTSNTGLGAVGAYCGRFVRDEAGLISSDIYPFLKGYSEGFNHWHKILEYMKALRIDYFTTFPPYGAENRHTQTVAEIEEPSLKGTRFEKTMRVRISRFIAPETYDLWADYEKEASFADRAPTPVYEDRVRLVQWEGKNTVTMRVLPDPADIRQRMIFPTHAQFTSGIGFDAPGEFAADNTATVEIKVNYGNEVKTLLSKTYPLKDAGRQIPIDSLNVSLSEYSGKFAFILYGAHVTGSHSENIWVGWIEPKLLSQAEL